MPSLVLSIKKWVLLLYVASGAWELSVTFVTQYIPVRSDKEAVQGNHE